MRLPSGVTVTVYPWVDGGLDEYNNETGGFGEPFDVVGCAYAPDRSTEPNMDGRRPVLTSGTVYGPVGVDVKPADEVGIPGAGRFRVVGEVARWRGVFLGTTEGAEFAVEKVT